MSAHRIATSRYRRAMTRTFAFAAALAAAGLSVLAASSAATGAQPPLMAKPVGAAPAAVPPLVTVFAPDTVKPGETTSVRVYVEPAGSRCIISAWYPSGDLAAAQPAKTAPATGEIRWSWLIPMGTTPGKAGRVDVGCTTPEGGVGAGRASLAVTSGLTVNGKTTLNGPAVVNMDTTHPGLTINGHADSLAQPLAVFDYLGNPIFYVASDGGAGVTGDDFLIFPPGDVFNPVIRLGKRGAVTAVSVQLGGPSGVTLFGGAADPNEVSPCPAACPAGARYFRSNGDTLAYLGGVWVVR